MSDKSNQAQLSLDIENFLKYLKRRRTEWDSFYEELADLILDFKQMYDPDYEYTGYLKLFIILYFDLTSIDYGFDSLCEELENLGFNEIRSWFLDMYDCFEKDYQNIEL